MPTPFVADAADEAVRSESILNERKAADIIEETALEVDIRAWRAEGLRLLQAASAREDHVPNGARRPCSVLGDASAQAAIEDAVPDALVDFHTGRGWDIAPIARHTVFAGAGLLQCINQIVATRLPPLLKHGPHAIDATPARRRGSEVHPTHWMIYPQALPRSVTGAKDPTAPTQSEGGIDRYQLSNAPEVAVTLERHSLSPYRLTLTDGL